MPVLGISHPFASSVPSTAQLLLGPAFRFVSSRSSLRPPSCEPMQGLVRHGHHPRPQYYEYLIIVFDSREVPPDVRAQESDAAYQACPARSSL